MKINKTSKKVIKGAILGGSISLIANLITTKNPGWTNVAIASVLGIAVYLILHTEVFE